MKKFYSLVSFVLCICIILSPMTVLAYDDAASKSPIERIKNEDLKLTNTSVDLNEYKRLTSEIDALILEEQEVNTNAKMNAVDIATNKQRINNRFNEIEQELIKIGASKQVNKTNIMPSDDHKALSSTNLVDQIYDYYGDVYLISGYQTTVTHPSGTYTIYEMLVQSRPGSSALKSQELNIDALSKISGNITLYNNIIQTAITIGTSFIPNAFASIATGYFFSEITNKILNGSTVYLSNLYRVDCITNTKQYFDFVWNSANNNWVYCHAVNTALDTEQHRTYYDYINESGEMGTGINTTKYIENRYISNPNFAYSYTDAVNAYRAGMQSFKNINYYDIKINNQVIKNSGSHTIALKACAHYNDLQYLDY